MLLSWLNNFWITNLTGLNEFESLQGVNLTAKMKYRMEKKEAAQQHAVLQ